MSREEIVEALRRLDPMRPAPAPFYGERTWKGTVVSRRLEDEVRLFLEAEQQFRILLHGAVGSGKTTELVQLGVRLHDVACVVPVHVSPNVDLKGWFSQVFEAVAACIPTWELGRPATLPLVDPAGRRLLLLVDGLDLAPTERIQEIFGPGSPLVASWLPAVIYTCPQGLTVLGAEESCDPNFVVRHLPPFPVLRPDATVDPEAVGLFTSILARRFEGLDILAHSGMLERVAILSAGIPRDAIRILRTAVLSAASMGRVNWAHLAEGEREVRQSLLQGLSGIDTSNLWIEMERSLWFGGEPRLVVNRAVVAFEGEEGRYWLPHPLLKQVQPELYPKVVF